MNAAGNNAIVLHPGANHRLQRKEISASLQQLTQPDSPGYLLLQNEVNDLPWLITHGNEQGL